jgi:hypothetical protein
LIRVGATSVDSIDSETSIASMMVARSSGCFVSTDGRASAADSTSSVRMNATAGTCRRQPRPFGAIVLSRSTLVNFMAYARRCSVRQTYTAASSNTGTAASNHTG